MSERKLEPLQLDEVGRLSTGDYLRAAIDYEGSICIETCEPWAGDTETGFGREASVRLTNEQARALAAWLTAALGSDTKGER